MPNEPVICNPQCLLNLQHAGIRHQRSSPTYTAVRLHSSCGLDEGLGHTFLGDCSAVFCSATLMSIVSAYVSHFSVQTTLCTPLYYDMKKDVKLPTYEYTDN